MAKTLKEILTREAKPKPVEKVQESGDISLITNLATNQHSLLAPMDLNNAQEEQLIKLYRNMDNDAIISAALDFFADNATQVNERTGHVITIESSEKKFQEEINEFLWKEVKMDTEAWHIIRAIARDGRVLLDTAMDSDRSGWYFREVEDPSKIFALVKDRDDVEYFAVAPEEKEEPTTNNSFASFMGDNKKTDVAAYKIAPKDAYIVGIYSRLNKGKMQIESSSNLTGLTTTEEYYIRSGRSILAPVVHTWQALSSLEDSLFINRLSKSTAFKIVEVDVTGANNKQAQQIIDGVKNALRSTESIDSVNERYQNRQAPMPLNDFIYIPKKGTVGSVVITPIGGEVGEVQMADINHYRNKLFAGLGVLKAYLGFEETTPGGMGDSALNKLDERSGRRIKRFQETLKHVVEQIISFYWRYSKQDRSEQNLPEYKIILGNVSTAEQENARKALTDNLQIANSTVTLAKDQVFEGMVSPDKLFKYVFESILGIPIEHINNTPEPANIDVKIHDLSNETGQEHEHYVTGDVKGLIKEEELKTLLEEYEIVLVDDKYKEVKLENFIRTLRGKELIKEDGYAKLKDLSKRRDPVRLNKSKKITVRYTGIDKDDYITFVATAEDPVKNAAEGKPVSYNLRVSLDDIAPLIVRSQEEELTDKYVVGQAMQGNVHVSCNCPAATYWGQEYNGTVDNYSLVKNTIPPTRNIPTQVVCKHTLTVLTVLPFWTNTIIRDLRNKGLLSGGKKKVKPSQGKTKDDKE